MFETCRLCHKPVNTGVPARGWTLICDKYYHDSCLHQAIEEFVEKNMNIISRNDVLKNIEKDEAAEIIDVIKVINQKISESKELPVRFKLKEFGSTLRIKSIIIDRLKAAGWGVHGHSLDGEESYYEVK